MKKFLIIVTYIVFLISLITIFNVNTQVSGYLHNGYFATYSPVDFKYIILSFVLSILFIFLIKYLKFSKKISIILVITLNILMLIVRIVLVNSFDIAPAGDPNQVFQAVVNLSNGKLGDFLKGGYITIYSHQLGFSVFLLPFVELFGYNFASYYLLNALLIQSANLLISLSFYKKDNPMTILWINVGLNLFLPNLFFQFILYSDPISWFLFAIIIYLFTKSDFKSIQLLVFSFIFLFMAVAIKAFSVVLAIAFIILFIFYKRLRSIKLTVLFVLLFSCSLFLPKTLLESSFNSIYKTEVGEYSLPASTWLVVGLSGAGFTPEYANVFASYDNDETLMDIYMSEKLEPLITRLYNPDTLISFLQGKIQFTWTNPDFDSMSYIMPQVWGAELVDFFEDNSLRLGRATADSGPTNEIGNFIYKYMFSIRNIEKVYFMSIVECAIISVILSLRKEKKLEAILYPLIFVGIYLLFLILETQPHYVYVATNILIVYVFSTLQDMLNSFNFPFKKWYS